MLTQRVKSLLLTRQSQRQLALVPRLSGNQVTAPIVHLASQGSTVFLVVKLPVLLAKSDPIRMPPEVVLLLVLVIS